ncbi:hypothetical protein AAZX31_07G229200 [Glycine max]|uniref:Uncharacterized protein n=2 Tax=Glycine subgen. Soja TaxID=1462606 RepID=I1KMY8_SOYBN|nr:uncharacterized protein LOC100807241 [Glycine max]XP_028241682.1 uncharacterized protein LOC114420039 [Glycine soja]KAG5011123.1 hypothetical protein JHK87_019638 [Glycine soja]KAH1088469.1 hypothetical protein GYH30_019486 [Glycine max]KAH1243624.1 hypothetical protein GmHk_07G020667 [Glycine max]KHN02964.1 hypothetical protein glysoja_009830 [Glycine soja]KRH50841.1 hypothetical protein GLYMA_07G247200v4 [Glycine max]|eukprot:XP_003528641.2 uncharacterized protein LOC100807241 [Glycine max]
MATAHNTLSSLLAPQATGRTTLRIPISSKRHRKNHLRPKILKILTKPYPLALPLLPSLPPPQPIVLPQENNNLCVEIPAGQSDKFEELQVSEGTAKDNGVFQNVSAMDIFKYGGLYFLGFFVLQTIYTVWIVGVYKSNQKDGELEIDGRENRDEKTVSLPVNGASNAFLSEEQLLMEKKIEEIKLMAREARRIESEKKGKEDEDEDFEVDDDEGAVSGNRLGIEKEIGERLLRLQNRINGSAKDISAGLQINIRGNSAAGVDRGVNKDVNKGNEALVFKKKFKFKSPSNKATKTPKGFPGNRDWNESKVKKRGSESKEAAQDYGSDVSDHAQMLHEDKPVNQQDAVTQKSVSNVPSEEGGKFVDDKSKATRDSINGSLRNGLSEKNSAANRVKVKQANTKTDMWWLNLRYVFVILMQRDSEEGSEGLYSLKFTSKEQEQSDDDSYTVAFEDHADANNFCFLLKSFFEDLGSFSADAVPMSIQELNEEIISRAKKVVVVKKRQLQLYAGQPLADVEMALRSIIEQDQNAPSSP